MTRRRRASLEEEITIVLVSSYSMVVTTFGIAIWVGVLCNERSTLHAGGMPSQTRRAHSRDPRLGKFCLWQVRVSDTIMLKSRDLSSSSSSSSLDSY